MKKKLFLNMLTFFFKYYEKKFSIKLFYFPMFGSIFKWVEKQSPNFLYLD